jgi:hypothetical protein
VATDIEPTNQPKTDRTGPTAWPESGSFHVSIDLKTGYEQNKKYINNIVRFGRSEGSAGSDIDNFCGSLYLGYDAKSKTFVAGRQCQNWVKDQSQTRPACGTDEHQTHFLTTEDCWHAGKALGLNKDNHEVQLTPSHLVDKEPAGCYMKKTHHGNKMFLNHHLDSNVAPQPARFVSACVQGGNHKNSPIRTSAEVNPQTEYTVDFTLEKVKDTSGNSSPYHEISIYVNGELSAREIKTWMNNGIKWVHNGPLTILSGSSDVNQNYQIAHGFEIHRLDIRPWQHQSKQKEHVSGCLLLENNEQLHGLKLDDIRRDPVAYAAKQAEDARKAQKLNSFSATKSYMLHGTKVDSSWLEMAEDQEKWTGWTPPVSLPKMSSTSFETSNKAWNAAQSIKNSFVNGFLSGADTKTKRFNAIKKTIASKEGIHNLVVENPNQWGMVFDGLDPTPRKGDKEDKDLWIPTHYVFFNPALHKSGKYYYERPICTDGDKPTIDRQLRQLNVEILVPGLTCDDPPTFSLLTIPNPKTSPGTLMGLGGIDRFWKLVKRMTRPRVSRKLNLPR